MVVASNESYIRDLKLVTAAAKNDFAAFVLFMNPPNSYLKLGRLHRYFIRLVQDMADGKKGKRQSVSVPPQHGKSTFLSVLASAWLLGRNRDFSIALTGAIATHLQDLSKQVRSKINDPRFRMVFPDVQIVFGSNNQSHWRLTNGSEFIAKPAGSKLTGRKVDWLIIDDAHKGREDAESPTMRKRIVSWYHADCYTRLSPDACVLVVATRWHEEDLIGYLISDKYRNEMIALDQETELFNHIVIEAICEDEANDPLHRKLGDPLAPELGRGLRFLGGVQAALPAYEWNSQFQGRPQAQASGQADVSRIGYIETLDELPEGCDIARGWDLALTEATASDFSAGPLCAYHRPTDTLYILDLPAHQKSWAKMKPIIVAHAEEDLRKHGCALIGIEAVTGFKIAHSELRDALLGTVHVKAVEATKSKLMRAQPWINLLEARRLILLRGAWNKPFLNELAIFPTGKHDDRVDGVSVAYTLFKRKNLLLA